LALLLLLAVTLVAAWIPARRRAVRVMIPMARPLALRMTSCGVLESPTAAQNRRPGIDHSSGMTRLFGSRFEREARKLGWTRIAGLDEAGRGALFGPVVAAAASESSAACGLDDSNITDSRPRSRVLAEPFREHALAWAVAEIDASGSMRGIFYQSQAARAMTAALEQLTMRPGLFAD